MEVIFTVSLVRNPMPLPMSCVLSYYCTVCYGLRQTFQRSVCCGHSRFRWIFVG